MIKDAIKAAKRKAYIAFIFTAAVPVIFWFCVNNPKLFWDQAKKDYGW